MTSSNTASKINSGRFYVEYYGHDIDDLSRVLEFMRAERPSASAVWLAGDSSLDNKHWLFPNQQHGFAAHEPRVMHDPTATAEAVNGWERILKPARMVKDVCYWTNAELEKAGVDAFCLNCAREESTIQDREGEASSLMPQDEFIRDNIRADDTLVVSVGGNDIALRPSAMTILHMANLIYGSNEWMIKHGMVTSLLYFQDMYGRRVKRYVEKLVAKTKPKRVIINMLYFLDETAGGSWADPVLERLGYDANPSKLQTLIRKIYETATSRIAIEGVEVVPLALYEIMDGKDSNDYDQRVEPSVQGGSKMGKHFVERMVAAEEEAATASAAPGEKNFTAAASDKKEGPKRAKKAKKAAPSEVTGGVPGAAEESHMDAA